LLAAVEDGEQDVRRAAAMAVMQLKGVEHLMAALRAQDGGVRVAAAEAVGRIDIRLLIAALRDEEGVGKQAAAVALGRSHNPRAVEPLLGALKDPEVGWDAARALGELGDQRAVHPLTDLLTDRQLNEKVAHALVALGYTPQTDSDRIHLLVAQRNRRALQDQWELTKHVLLKDLESGNYQAKDNAMQALIGIGNQDIIPSLIELLNKRGAWEGVSIANWYLKSGNSDLEAAARAWAQKTPGVYMLPDLSRRAESERWGAW
jgi:HEAT repeat protein